MKIIDAHLHFSPIASFIDFARDFSNVDYSLAGFEKEAKGNNVVHAICMGLAENSSNAFPDKNAETPMLANLAEELPSCLSLCLGVNPHTLNEQSLKKTEDLIKNRRNIAGLKIYAGYYHFDVCDPVYTPVFHLAEKYDLAVAIHSGDTFSDRGLLVFSHPLSVDKLAVTYRDLRIIICHLGSPWIFDACEVAFKNRNVFLDLSGILAGNSAYLEYMTSKQLFVDRLKSALIFLDNYEKVLFGTDWPLAPMDAYIEFCKLLLPPETHEKVFFQNAVDVYKLKSTIN